MSYLSIIVVIGIGLFTFRGRLSSLFDKVKPIPAQKGHYPPSRSGSFAYEGGYCSISECGDCGIRGMYWDYQTGKPCRECGGKRVEKVAKWDKDHWVLKGENDG